MPKKRGLHYTTVKRYVNLLEFAKKMPKIEVLKGEGTTLVRLERDLSKLDEEESKKIIRQHFPELDEEEKFLISLLEKNATKESRAIKLNITKMLERMIKLERVKETKDEKFYLTQLGYGISSGAKEIYLA